MCMCANENDFVNEFILTAVSSSKFSHNMHICSVTQTNYDCSTNDAQAAIQIAKAQPNYAQINGK